MNVKEAEALVNALIADGETHRLLAKKPAETEEVEKTEEVKETVEIEETPVIEAKIDVEEMKETVIVEKPVEETWTYEDTWQSMIYAYYPGAFGKQSYPEIKAAVDAFRKAHGISFQSGIPVGQKIQFKPFTVNGTTYYPDKNGADNKDGALNTFGWQSPFFNQKWDVKPKEISRLTVKEYKDGEKTVYVGVRTNADGTTEEFRSEESADAVVKNLTPEASKDADIKLTITVKDSEGNTTQRTKTINKKD